MTTNDPASVGGAKPARALENRQPRKEANDFDPNDYMDELDGFDISEAEKVELLQTLWSILTILVELRVDVHNLTPVFDASRLGDADAVSSPINDHQ